jgi:two-component system KDP operon response regulator KdpE
VRILLVEDDATLRATLTIALAAEGHHVLPAADGRTALDAVREDQPDLVILDLGLPDIDGTRVLAELRAGSSIPVLVLSARSDPSDKVGALDIGADDYLTKPFGTEELAARIRAAGRRARITRPVVVTGELWIDLTDRRLTRAGAEVHLTPTEWALLSVLVAAEGHLVTNAELLRDVWGAGYQRETNYLRTYVSTLRKKLEADPAHPRHLTTEPGQGYRFLTT